jgi:predicted 3-demethylubiquinone-9 3-methyltransferase (glyoxalase superfamily)
MSDKITTCLWFDTEGEAAAEFYCSVIPNSKVTDVSRYGESFPERAGTAMTVSFELDGRPYVALNGGPEHTFNESVSFQVGCEDQAEVDHYWEALTADGGEEGPCGWCKDKFGLSWQVIPTGFDELFGDPDPSRAARAMKAMFGMKKLDLAALQRAADTAD